MEDGLTLKLDLVLNNEGLVLVVNLRGELGRDGMVSSRVLENETLITLHSLVDLGLFDGPFSNICPLLIIGRGILLGVGRLPSLLPVVGELLEEVGLESSGL